MCCRSVQQLGMYGGDKLHVFINALVVYLILKLYLKML
jgi:hypothetical protein